MFFLIISKNHKIKSYELVSIPNIFWQLIMDNLFRLIIDISKIRIYYHTFLKKNFKISILVSRIR